MLPFSLIAYLLIGVICAFIFYLLHIPGKKVPQSGLQNFGRKLLRGFAWFFYIAAVLALLLYNIFCCEHMTFFKIIWAVLLLFIVACGYVMADDIWIHEPKTGWPYKWKNMDLVDDEPLAIPLSHYVSKKKYRRLKSNPVMQKVIAEARRLDAAAILCEPRGIKIYSGSSISPTNCKVFLSSDEKDLISERSGIKRDNDYFMLQFERWLYVQETPDTAIAFNAENFPSMEEAEQKNFSAVAAQLLGNGYIVFGHTGTLSWSTLKEIMIETTYDGISRSNVIKGNSGSIHGFYTSIVKKELAAACAKNKTINDREKVLGDLSSRTSKANKW